MLITDLAKQSCNAAELMVQVDLMQVMANRAGITLSISPQAIQFDSAFTKLMLLIAVKEALV